MKRTAKPAGITTREFALPGGMDRREFMRKLGGGLIIAFSVSELQVLAGLEPEAREEGAFNAFLRIGEDGRVTLFTGKIEMGQGPITSLPMMLADELDVSLESVDIIMGDTDLCPWDNGTFGSLTTRRFGQQMREAAAEARAILLEMASGELSVPVDKLVVMDGNIYDESDETKQISYAQLTRGKKILETISKKPGLKKAADFKIMGTSRHHVDSYQKVTGEAKYSGDIKLPGMLYARIKRPPSLDAKLLSADVSGAESMEGVEVVREGDFIAVLHESQDMADIAITKISAEFEEDDTDVNDQSIFEYLVERATETRERDAAGNIEDGRRQSDRIFESEFRDPYLLHAPLENHTATAVFEEGKMKVWASCQNPFPTGRSVARELGIPEENVRVMQIFTGGGFGGKTSNPQAIEAARLAKLTGRPVQVVYPRQEEFLYDRMRPAAVIKIKSGISEEGKMTFWDYNLYFGGSRGSQVFYDIPDHRTVEHGTPRGSDGHPFYTGAWRGPSNNTNTFARESQVDIMASEAGKDPLEFRLHNLEKDPKMAEVLKAGAEKFGWPSASNTGNRGCGMACGIDAGTYVAVFVEIEVNRDTGHIQVKRVVSCQNMGLVVNPQGATIQAEGCVIMGLGYALREEMKFEGRRMLTRNFDTYEIPRFSWTPDIEVVLIEAQDEPPQGGGEPTIICMGAAIANALYDAAGARVYQLPMTPERVLEAIRRLPGK